MLAFARETRLAETTYVQSARLPEADYRNRIWTVAQEILFAGHPSLGTAVAVAQLRRQEEVTYVLETGAGLQRVTVAPNGRAAWASVLQEPVEFGSEFDAAAVMEAVGLEPRDAHPELPPRMISTGLPTLVAPLADASALDRVNPDRAAVRALDSQSFNLYPAWANRAAGRARARSIPSVPAEGEDPATGSAAAPLLAYLHDRFGVSRLEVTQGVEIGRPSRLVVTIEDGRVCVRGGVAVVGTGHVRLP